MTEPYNGFGELQFAQDDHSTAAFIAKQVMNGMATATLVLVKAVDSTALTVDVQPMVSQIDGSGKAIDHGKIHALPYFALRAGASAVLVTPKAGDIGLVVFCHNDTSSVRKNKKPSPPGSRRRFDWADGIYLGGLLGPTPTTLVSLDDDTGVTVTVPDGKAITLTGNVTITGDVSVSGTLTADTDVVGGGKSLKDHTHGGVQTGSGTSGPPS